jgi:hypothetical protein
MMIAEAVKKSSGSRDDETTRVFRRPALPVPAPQGPATVVLLLNQDLYLLAPSPWPRGQFQIDPER